MASTLRWWERLYARLRLCGMSPDGLNLQVLALRTDYFKSSLHRIVRSLRIHNYIEQDVAGGKYSLGMQLLGLASVFVSRVEPAKVGRSCFDITGSSR